MRNILAQTLFYLILFLSTINNIIGQDYFIETTLPTSGLNRFSVCGGKRTITVKLTNISSSTLTKDTLTFVLPKGFDYSAGTLTGAGVTEADTSAPSFAFTNVAPGGIVQFSIKVEVLCAGVVHATGSANTNFSLNLKYIGGNGSQNHTSAFFEVVKPTLSFSKIGTKISTNPDIVNAAKYNSFNIDVTIANGGNGALPFFEYCIIDHPQLTIDSITITGYGRVPVTRTKGDSIFFIINSAMIAKAVPYTGVGADPNTLSLFQFNETLVLKEHWTATDCSVNPPDIERIVLYRCQSIYACEKPKVRQGVRFGYTRPDLTLKWLNTLGSNYPVCMGDTLHYYGACIINSGNEGATDMRFSIYVGADNYGGTFLDTSTILFSRSKNGPYFKYPIAYTEMLTGISPACLASAGSKAQPISRANYFMQDFLLMPGDTLFIKFGYRVGCYCGDLNRNVCSNITSSRDFRRIIYGYYKPNEVNTGSDIQYWDACKQFKYTDSYIITNDHYYYYNTLGEGQGTTLNNGEKGSVYFQGQGSLSTLAYHSSYFNCKSCYTDYLYIFPAGVDWAGTNGDLNTSDWTFTDQSGDLWKPNLVIATNHPTGFDTLKIRHYGAPPSVFSMNANSIFKVNYKIDCSEVACGFYSGVPIWEEAYFNLDTDCSTCGTRGDQVDCRESVPITFECACSGPGCNDGMVFKNLKAERRTFGKADNNNNTITDAGETLDTTKLLLSRVLPGDTIRTIFNGEVRATSIAGFSYAFAEIVFPSPISSFLPVGAKVTIYDASTGSTIKCNVLQQFIAGNNKIVTNISSANLRALGCTALPTNWKYEHGDLVTVEVYFITRTNVGGTVSPKVYNTRFYVSNQDYGGTAYQCNPRDFLLTHIGYAFYESPGSSYNMKGCNVGYMDIDHRMRIGSSWDHRAGADLFPFEVREPFTPKTVALIKKSDLIMTGTVLIRYYPLLVNNPGQYQVNYKEATINFSNPFVTVLGDTVLVDVKGWLDANGNGKISYDQGFYIRIYAELLANCSTALSSGYDKLNSYTIKSTTDPRLTTTPNYTAFRNNVKDISFTEKPNIAIQVSPKTRQVIENPTCFTLDLVNAGQSNASNVYLAFDDFNGSVVVYNLYEIVGTNKTLITPTALGLYQIGILNNGKTRTFELCVQSNNCSMDSLKISTGWDCTKYPTSLEEAECGQSSKVYLFPVQSELGMIISNPLTETTEDLCEELEYEVTLSSADIGSLNDINLYFSLPSNMTYKTGSMQLLYPVTGSYKKMADPQPMWDGYSINVSKQDPLLSTKGLPGTIQIGKNVAKVKFKVQTQCNYTSGSRVKFLSYAFDPCGDFANYRFSPAPKHHINGVSVPFASSVNVQNLSLNACAKDNSTLDISLSLSSSSQPIGPKDSVAIILPAGVRYVNNSYTPISNAVTTAPLIETKNGTQVIYIDLKDGVTSGNNVQFKIDIEAFDIGQDCRDYDITIQSFNSQNAFCATTSSNCNVRVISSGVSKKITIEKPSYTINWNSAMATPISSDTLSLAYSVIVQNNTAIPIDSTVGVVVEIYNDTNGDGRFSSGDTKVATSWFKTNINALQTLTLTDTVNIHANKLCNLLAVINPQTACACSEDESFLIDAELNNTFPREASVCSNEPVTFGPNLVSGYTYQWFGLGGAAISALNATLTSPVQFTYDNNTGVEIVWDYVVRMVSGAGCYSYDTMQITIYPEINNIVTTGTCAGFPTTLNGPAGTSGIWTPSTNVANVNNPISSLTGITSTTTYTWTYTDSKGCPAYYRQTVALTGCSQRTMIGDYVWRDDNRNGVQDAGEPPLPNVPVYLFDADNPTIPLTTTYTNINGYYQFKPIPAGNYRVGFGNIYDYDPSPKDAGSNDSKDSDIDPLTLYTVPILIANGDSITNVDAGFMPMQKIGNYVWSDLDSNGVQNAGEPPIQGVTVHLYKANGTLVATTTTNANGAYVFRVISDTYYLVFDANTNASKINYVTSPQNNSGNTETDSDINQLGRTANFALVVGQNRLDLDAGFNGVEDCDNNIDDDSDGATDCLDTDCMPVISNVAFQAPTCVGGGQNGSIVITAKGLGTLMYSINNSPLWQTSNTFNNLGIGTYFIRVKNTGGCMATYTNNPTTFDLTTCIEICDDNIDNDGDGLVDCDDPDCDPNIPTPPDIIQNK
jgi:hypothetical protein